MPGTARSSSENRQIGRAKSRFRITIFHLPSRIESAASTLLALSNSKGVALRSEDSAISSVTNKSVRINKRSRASVEWLLELPRHPPTPLPPPLAQSVCVHALAAGH